MSPFSFIPILRILYLRENYLNDRQTKKELQLVVFMFSKTFFRKKYALTSLRISRKVSRIITSLPDRGKEDRPPVTLTIFNCNSILSFSTYLKAYQSSTKTGE